MQDNRPDPDRLLQLVNSDPSQRGRGRLKIFFAASAGSGKTYAMLSDAKRLRLEGVDVLAGVIEHHGRTETAELAASIPALSMREIVHRGISLAEFDLDAALEAKPDIILVDELAHSNAPGSRHPKRWQDIEELLNNGIDVYTTLNVQHLESLNDIVARLTGVWVRETVPDHVFEQADEIELIDISSEELLKRLADGKVYIAEGANRLAADSFFKKANLMALRELALRRTAERVEQQSDALQTSLGQADVVVGLKILVVVDHDPLSSRLIRIGRRMASRAKAPFSVLYLVNSHHNARDETSIARMDQQIRLAEDLGAGAIRLSGLEPAREILDYAEHHGFSRIVVGYRKPQLWRRLIDKPLSQRLIEGSNGIEIITVNGDQQLKSEHASQSVAGWRRMDRHPLHYAYAFLIVLFCTLIGLPFRGLINPYNLTMVFMTGVVFSAVRLGTGPSMLTAALGIAAFNLFYIEPYYVFTAFDQSYYFTFAVMLITSLLGGSLTGRLRDHSDLARKRESEVGILYDLSRGLSSIHSLDSVAAEINTHIGAPFQVRVVLWIGDGQTLATYPAEEIDLRERSAALWSFENKNNSGRGTDTMPSANGFYVPLIVHEQAIGVVAFYPDDPRRRFAGSEIQQFETFASLLAVAIQRTVQADEAAKSRAETENEKLRNALLASLSHDLRTPLTVMNGGLSALLRMRKRLPREALDEITSLWTQLNGLQKFVSNLLKMAAITSGTLKLKREPYMIPEIMGAALSRVEDLKGDRSISTSVAGQLPMIDLDGGLIEQVIINLLENAIAHTEPDGNIGILAERDADTIRIRISDDGPGLEPGTEELIFGQSHLLEGQRPDRRGADSNGLGLVICRAIVQAHGGMIYAKNNPARDGAPTGSSFIFTLPINRTPE